MATSDGAQHPQLVMGAPATEWLDALAGAQWHWLGLARGHLRWETECRPASSARESAWPVTLEEPVTPEVSLWQGDVRRTWTWGEITGLAAPTDVLLRIQNPRTVHGRWYDTLATLMRLAETERAGLSVWAARLPDRLWWAPPESPRTIECPACGAPLPLVYVGYPPAEAAVTCSKCRLTITYRLVYEARYPKVTGST